MKFATGMSAIGAFIAAGLLAGAEAQPWRDRDGPRAGGPQWENLGCFSIGVVPERGILPVGRAEGQFRALRLTAGGKDVEVQDILVVYGNGQPETIPFRAIVKEGQPSNPIDLRGRDRAIQRIEMIARKRDRGFSFSKAQLCVSALEDERRPRPPEAVRWEKLGCVDYGRRLEIGTVPVGRREGRYKAIRLEVGGDPMRIEDLTVVYANGSPATVDVQTDIRAGSISNPIDLQGRDRAIDRIEVSGRKLQRQWTPGRATLCISGLEDVRRPEPPALRWSDLGCAEVGRRLEPSTIAVGRREGRFKAIRFSVAGKDVRFEEATVVYANGRPDEIDIRADIAEGQQTKPIDLQGFDRAIDRIEVIARKRDREWSPGRAQICAAGLEEGPARPEPPKARWDKLGCVEARRRPETASIPVGRKDGFIRSLFFESAGADVAVEDLRVNFSNGRSEQPRVTEIIQAGVKSKPIELQNPGPTIESVVVTARKEDGQRGVPGQLCLQGLVILEPPARPGRW